MIFMLTAIVSQNAHRLVQMKGVNITIFTLLGGLLLGIGSGLLIHFQLWWFALILFVGIYLIENIRKPILTGLLSDKVSNAIFTSVLSAQSFYKTMVTAILAVLLGVLTDLLGIGLALILISSTLVFASAGTNARAA